MKAVVELAERSITTAPDRSELYSIGDNEILRECPCKEKSCIHDKECITCKLPNRHVIHSESHSHYHPFTAHKMDQIGAHMPASEIVTMYTPQKLLTTSNDRSIFVLNPNNKFFPKWDIFMLILLCFTASFTPYEVAFLETNTLLEVVNRCVDFCFFSDMLFNFLKAFFDPIKNKWIWEHKLIAIKYMKGWFILDFISTFPFELIMTSLEGNSPSASSLKLLRFFRLFKLFKLLRVVRASRIIRRWETVIDLRYSLLSLAGFIFSMVFLAHWGACLWGMVPQITESEMNWMIAYGIDDGTAQEKYVAALYWAFMTVTTIGYGDVPPQTQTERIVALIFMALGAALYAYIVGSVCSVLSSLDQATHDFHQTMDHLNAYMAQENTSYALRVRLRTFFVHCQGQYHSLLYQKVLERMSPGLRGQFVLESHQKWIAQLSLFRNISSNEKQKFLIALVMHFKLQSYPPKEEIIRPGEKPERMYVISKGLCSKMGVLLGKGKAFGEDFILQDTPFGRRYYAVRSLSFTDVYILEQHHLYSVLSSGEFPLTRKTIKIHSAKMLLIRWGLAESARIRKKRKSINNNDNNISSETKTAGEVILNLLKQSEEELVMELTKQKRPSYIFGLNALETKDHGTVLDSIHENDDYNDNSKLLSRIEELENKQNELNNIIKEQFKLILDRLPIVTSSSSEGKESE